MISRLVSGTICAMALLLAAMPVPAQENYPQPEQEPQSIPHNVSPEALVTVHGVVMNSATGKPLPRALVVIAEGDTETTGGALTDNDGRFEISGVHAGPQAFGVIKPGYSDHDASGEDSAHNVLVASEMPDLVFTLTPNSSIRGQVGLSTGDSAGHIVVYLLQQVVQHGRAEWATVKAVRTDAEGFYHFNGLQEGLYTVGCEATLESAPATTLVDPENSKSVALNGFALTFYPNVRQLAAAGKIRLGAGEQVQANIDLTQEPFYPVSASILVPDGGTLLASTTGPSGKKKLTPAPLLLDSDYHFSAYHPRYDAASQTVQAILPDGNYVLGLVVPASFISTAGEAGSALGYQHPSYFTGLAVFTVAGHALKNLLIPLFAPPSYPLHLRAQSSSTKQSGDFPTDGLTSVVSVSLIRNGEFLLDANSQLDMIKEGTDSFDLMRAPPFSYWVHTRVYGQGLCAGELTASWANLARESLTLSFSGPPGPMEFTVRNDCARLTLSLPASLTAFNPGIEPVYTVYVVPDFDTTEDVEPQTLSPSSESSLTLQQLTPGNYHVYTFTHQVELEYKNPAAMAQLPIRGQPVTLSPGGAANLVLEVPER
jgi:hypothetical protein